MVMGVVDLPWLLAVPRQFVKCYSYYRKNIFLKITQLVENKYIICLNKDFSTLNYYTKNYLKNLRFYTILL
jgi:hypothetical protein